MDCQIIRQYLPNNSPRIRQNNSPIYNPLGLEPIFDPFGLLPKFLGLSEGLSDWTFSVPFQGAPAGAYTPQIEPKVIGNTGYVSSEASSGDKKGKGGGGGGGGGMHQERRRGVVPEGERGRGDRYPREVVYGFETYGDAVWAALTQADRRAKLNGVEVGGVIFRNSDGTFGYTVQFGNEDSVLVNPFANPSGTRNQSTYHAHGRYDSNFRGEVFSQGDYDKSNEPRRTGGMDAWLVTPSQRVLFHPYFTAGLTQSYGTLDRPTAP